MKKSKGLERLRQDKERLRRFVIPTVDGLAEIAIRNRATASMLGQYWNAARWFLETGDGSRLRPFRKRYITDAYGNRTPYLTDLDELERLGSAGVLSFESIYAKVR